MGSGPPGVSNSAVSGSVLTTISPRGKPWTTLPGKGILGIFLGLLAKIRGLAVVSELVYLLILCCVFGEIVKMSSGATDESTTFEDGQVVNSEPWADQVDEADEVEATGEQTDDNVSVSEEIAEEFELPEVLKQLMSVGGMRFVAVPEGTWNVSVYSAKLHRFYSVTLSVDDEISSSDIVETIIWAGVDVEHIDSIEFCSSNRSWCLTFTDQLSKEFILEKGVLHFGSVLVFVSNTDFRVVIVKVYEPLPKMCDTLLIG